MNKINLIILMIQSKLENSELLIFQYHYFVRKTFYFWRIKKSRSKIALFNFNMIVYSIHAEKIALLVTSDALKFSSRTFKLFAANKTAQAFLSIVTYIPGHKIITESHKTHRRLTMFRTSSLWKKSFRNFFESSSSEPCI